MKKVEFEKDSEVKIMVYVNGNNYGSLRLEDPEGVWVLWPDNIDDGISYFSNLKISEETIKDEIRNND